MTLEKGNNNVKAMKWIYRESTAAGNCSQLLMCTDKCLVLLVYISKEIMELSML